ncbi:DCXR [Mytilus edulis]|uniref:DCXR n=1 Tax=Mytilus edulis TaxID=6550 RepID=A0A8S3QF89_MYTED|nr:DCXR [Mytilus edulis]
MEVKLDGKRALVTGAGKGFGREIAKRIAECGAETFALSRTQEDLGQSEIREKGKGGSIVNISSIASRTVLPGASAYCSTKGAVDNITRCMALELGPHNIRVNSVNPTFVITNMTKGQEHTVSSILERTPMGRFPAIDDFLYYQANILIAEIKDVVNAVVFLLSDESGMISGESLRVDGGVGVY